MGLYISVNEDKEDWLMRHGIFLFASVLEPTFNYDRMLSPDNNGGHNRLIVCLVDNGAFTALGVAFDEREFNVFKKPDGRYKQWFLLDVDLIKENTLEWEHYIKDEK